MGENMTYKPVYPYKENKQCAGYKKVTPKAYHGILHKIK